MLIVNRLYMLQRRFTISTPHVPSIKCRRPSLMRSNVYKQAVVEMKAIKFEELLANNKSSPNRLRKLSNNSGNDSDDSNPFSISNSISPIQKYRRRSYKEMASFDSGLLFMRLDKSIQRN
jgi:hypothetical protein